MKGFVIVPNWDKKNIREILKILTDLLTQKNIPYEIAENNKGSLKKEDVARWKEEFEIIIVLGGDGTLLRVARETLASGFPILGINLGNLGFLAAIEISEIEKFMEKVFNKDYQIEERMMLTALIERNGQEMERFNGLNDVVISKGPFSRIINLVTYINDDFLETYPGDGIIVSTPTGSTGYSLSAGGPIINPSLELIMVTPICPHLLYHRSVIVDENDTIILHLKTSHPEVVLTVDGQIGFALNDDDKVIIHKSEHKVKLVSFPEKDFYRVLHKKLKMK